MANVPLTIIPANNLRASESFFSTSQICFMTLTHRLRDFLRAAVIPRLILAAATVARSLVG